MSVVPICVRTSFSSVFFDNGRFFLPKPFLEFFIPFLFLHFSLFFGEHFTGLIFLGTLVVAGRIVGSALVTLTFIFGMIFTGLGRAL